MAYRISWIGFEGLDRSACLSLIGMTDTGLPDEANETSFSLACLPTGWTILFSNDFDYVSDRRLAQYSRKCRVIGCRIHEDILYDSVTAFQNGRRLWSVVHDASAGHLDLQSSGKLPAEFAEINERLIRMQEADDKADANTDYIFDIPVELALVLTGYQHDRGLFAWGRAKFTEVLPAETGGRGWLQRLFGRNA